MFDLCLFEDIFCEQYREKSILLVMSQKGKSQNSGYKKTKHVNFSQQRTFLPPDLSGGTF